MPDSRWLALVLALVALGACGGETSPQGADAGADTRSDVDTADAAQDGDTDAGIDTDVPVDTATDVPVDTAPPDFAPGRSEAAREWTSVGDGATWLVGVTDAAGADATWDDLEDGSFGFPTLGGGPHGVRWEEAAFDEAGRITNGAAGPVFVAARFSVAEHEAGAIVQAEPAQRAWLDGRRRPVDVYGGTGVRVGWPVEPGDHELVVLFDGRRGSPLVRLWTTDQSVAFNTADMTLPHLVAGTNDVQWVGISTVALSSEPLAPVRTRVVGSALVEEATVLLPGIGPGATTQLPFELRPTGAWPDEGPVIATVRVEAPQLDVAYETTVEVEVVPAGSTYRRTRLSGTDGSVQYAGIVPPTGPEPDGGWGIVLSLHGAAVQAFGQAQSYAPKEWAYIVAPTNRRPYGFDWEVFGRLDALEALADAKGHFGHDPTRVHVTGHSMGGHGAWQLGSLFPTLFATVGPSAGWDSFYSYTGGRAPNGVFGRAQASSVTSDYAPENLRDRAVYVIHGDADDNVPVREARAMVALLEPVVDDLQYHEQPGAGHWWNVDPEGGADCVDWGPLFETMEDRRLDPRELEFTFRSPSPWVSPTHSFVTVDAVRTPMDDFTVASAGGDGEVVVTTTNVRRMVLDGDALLAAGVSEVVVDGTRVPVRAGPVVVGEPAAKRLGVAGPFNTALHAPFCFVYEAAGPEVYRELAAYWSAEWSAVGNGHACTVTFEGLTPWVEAHYQLVFMGVPPQLVAFDGPVAFELAGTTLRMDSWSWDRVALAAAYPYAGRQAALLIASDGREDLLFRYTPFQSRFVLPDFLVWGDSGARATGFFGADWEVDPLLAEGL